MARQYSPVAALRTGELFSTRELLVRDLQGYSQAYLKNKRLAMHRGEQIQNQLQRLPAPALRDRPLQIQQQRPSEIKGWRSEDRRYEGNSKHRQEWLCHQSKR